MTSLHLLASGSDGNAALLRTDETRLLIDCGLSLRELSKRLLTVGETPDTITAVLISHEHIDHVAGVNTMLKYLIKRGRMVRVYVTTHLAAAGLRFIDVEFPPLEYFRAGDPFFIGDILVDPITIPHDATDPVAFVFGSGQDKIGFATDLGFVPPAMERKFKSCRTIVVESNHDPERLELCPYPPTVKDRVSGRLGHLSNQQTGEFLRVSAGAAERVVLAHLGRSTNTPGRASEIASEGLRAGGSEAVIQVASYGDVLKVF